MSALPTRRRPTNRSYRIVKRLFRQMTPSQRNDDGTYTMPPAAEREILDNISQADIITSETTAWDGDEPLHAPVIDIDKRCWTVPSSTPGNVALYIDHLIPQELYLKLLDVMAECGIVEEGYAQVSRARRYSAVRLPWIDKYEETATTNARTDRVRIPRRSSARPPRRPAGASPRPTTLQWTGVLNPDDLSTRPSPDEIWRVEAPDVEF